MARGLRFDRNEWAGSFGDIGTDLPLVFGMVLAAGLDAASVFTVFGLLQIATGLVYRLPMPMQPLKAMAVLVITGGVAAEVLYGAGLAIGAVMLLLAATGALGWLARRIPLAVVRGIQLGLGLSLASLARAFRYAGHTHPYVVKRHATRQLRARVICPGTRWVYPIYVMEVLLLCYTRFRIITNTAQESRPLP